MGLEGALSKATGSSTSPWLRVSRTQPRSSNCLSRRETISRTLPSFLGNGLVRQRDVRPMLNQKGSQALVEALEGHCLDELPQFGEAFAIEVEDHLPEGGMCLQQLQERGSRQEGQMQGFDRHPVAG